MSRKKLVIEIRKAGFLNKGAELMLYSILEKMKEAYPTAKFVMAPHPEAAPYEERIKHQLYQKPDIWMFGIQWAGVFNLIPKVFRKMYGIVLDREVDVVIDAAGFAYGDQQGENATLGLADATKRWKKNKTKVILLPQAFGSFETLSIKKAMKVVVNNADLIFAREKKSYDYLVRVAGESSRLRMAPDFTNITKGMLPASFDSSINCFCLVPNYRMIDRTPKAYSEAYLPLMIESARYLLEKDLKPFVLIHERGDDLILAKKMSEAVGGRLPIIIETDPLKIKGIIGACEGMVGSRFHGLVSALSQGVPVVATGWSHKYQELLDDYGVPEGLLDVTCRESELHAKLNMLVNNELRKCTKEIIERKSELLKLQTKAMWERVFFEINATEPR